MIAVPVPDAVLWASLTATLTLPANLTEDQSFSIRLFQDAFDHPLFHHVLGFFYMLLFGKDSG